MQYAREMVGSRPGVHSSRPANSRIRVWPWTVKIGVAGALFSVSFLLFGLLRGGGEAELVLVVNPPDGLRVIMDGTVVLPETTSPLTVRRLEPGKHAVTIERNGFMDEQISIFVKPGNREYRGVLLKKATGGFSLDTEPHGATVWIDERPLEAKTPLVTRGISPGTHMVRIAKGNDYAPKTILVDVRQGEVTKVSNQKLLRKVIEVTFHSTPPGAVAHLITGHIKQPVGKTPVKTMLDLSKSHRIRYDLKGYHSVDEELDLEKIEASVVSSDEILVHNTVLLAEVKQTHDEALAWKSPKPTLGECPNDSSKKGTLFVQTLPWSRIYINGKYVKNTPLVAHNIEAGIYDVTLENPNYEILENFQVSISCGETTKLTKTYI